MPGVPRRLYGVDKILVGSDLNPSRPYVNTLWDRSLIVSENHRRYPSGQWSGGGPFYTWQRIITHGGQKTIPVFRIVDKGKYTALGVVGSPLTTPSVMTPPSWTSVKSTLAGLYATGYNKARPGNPVASVAQFLAELRDLPRLPFQNVFAKHGLKYLVPFKDIPRRLRDYHLKFRDLGGEYLNVVFGWLPFLSDLRKMFYLYQNLDKRLTDIVRQNGKFIRRRATIRDDTSVSQVGPTVYNFPYANVYGAPGEIDSPGKTIYTVTTRTETKEWFAGSFRYMLFEPDPSQWTSTCKAHLFGAVPTPSLLWELMPYSWLIDWFSNVGDVIQNASPNAVDNLTMKYSYIMRRTRTSTEWRASVSHGPMDTVSRKWPGVDHAWTSSDIVESKSRSGGGNPFGLNVQLADLSSAQLAILAALGISRASVK